MNEIRVNRSKIEIRTPVAAARRALSTERSSRSHGSSAAASLHAFFISGVGWMFSGVRRCVDNQRFGAPLGCKGRDEEGNRCREKQGCLRQA
jgi:hypothetical protein